jgi:hypothetical protein
MAGRDPDRDLFQARVKEWKTVHALAFSLGAFFAAWILFGLPRGFGLRSDDFGYVRSILLSLEQGGIRTYDWLAPFNAVMTGLCALLWRITGNFPVAVALYSGGAALLAFLLLFRLLAARTTPARAAFLSLAFALSPTFFNKAADFHGCMLTFALFLLALSAHESRRPGLFLAAAFLAFANRQSGIVLVLLPLVQAVEDIRRGRVIRARLPAYLALFTVCAWGLRLYMNRTYAQSPEAVFAAGDWPDRIRLSGIAFLAGAGFFFAFLSVFGLAGRSLADSFRENLARPFLPAFGSVVLVAASFFWPPDLFRTDFPLFGAVGWGTINKALPYLCAASLWALDRRLLRPSAYLILGFAYAALTALRGIWWDYYLLEMAALALLMAASRTGNRPMGAAALALVSLCIAAGLAYGYMLKVQADRQVLAAGLFERMERDGEIRVDEMTNAPFGFLGWKLFDHYLADEGRGAASLHEFQRYVRGGRVMIETHAPWRAAYRRPLPPSAVLLDSGRARIGYVTVEYRVADMHGPDTAVSALGPLLPLDPGRYLPRPFPLDGREWNDLAARAEGSVRHPQGFQTPGIP